MTQVKQEPDQTQYTHAAIVPPTKHGGSQGISYQNETQDTSHNACYF